MTQRSWPSDADLQVKTLGPCTVPSPLVMHGEPFVDEADRVYLGARHSDLAPFLAAGVAPPSFEPAGPRQRIFFNPATLGVGVVTCGGLCPGLNNVLRSVVLRLWYAYGVRRVLGFRYGYAGLAPRNGHAPLVLTPDVVEPLHEQGGTRLGTSRGPQDVGEMVEQLARLDVSLL